MQALYTNIAGHGRPLVLLHGWGMNSQVWQPIQAALTQQYHVTLVDLPGHGRSHRVSLGSLDEVVEQLRPHIPSNAVIMGWSLGGLVAQALAHALPEQVAGLILVASTPKFVANAAWQHAVGHEVLDTFARNLQTDYLGTVKRFFALQFLNTKIDSRHVSALRESIMAHPASEQALAQGLELLRYSDFIQQPVTQPTQWILGRLDKLIPVSLADALPTMGYSHVAVLNSAAHVPFVTHPELFMEHIGAFLDVIE